MNCRRCERSPSLMERMNASIGEEWICPACQEQERVDEGKQRAAIQRKANTIILTTTPSIDGFRVSAYLGIESVEIVIGTGFLSELSGDISDFLGQRSSRFESKLQQAKGAAVQIMRIRAAERDADAVIGIDLDYTEFTSNRIGLILSGTMVKLSRDELNPTTPG